MDLGEIKKFYNSFWKTDPSTLPRYVDSSLSSARQACLHYARELLLQCAENEVLFIGPGEGSELDACLRNRKVLCLDLSLEALKLILNRQQNINIGRETYFLINADAHFLPFRESSVDAVYISLVLMHSDSSVLFSELRRVVRIGGSVVVVEPLRFHPLGVFFRKIASVFEKTKPSYLSLKELLALGKDWFYVDHREFYLFSPFLIPLNLIKPFTQLYKLLIPLIERVDVFLLRVIPWLRPLSWMAVVKYTRMS